MPYLKKTKKTHLEFAGRCRNAPAGFLIPNAHTMKKNAEDAPASTMSGFSYPFPMRTKLRYIGNNEIYIVVGMTISPKLNRVTGMDLMNWYTNKIERDVPVEIIDLYYKIN